MEDFVLRRSKPYRIIPVQESFFFSSAAFYDIIIALDFFPELQTLNKVKIFSDKIYKS